jgi:hypothetical protein
MNCDNGYGICDQSTSKIINNTLSLVKFGVFCTTESTAEVINTIIWNPDSTYHYAIKQFDTGSITSKYCNLFTYYPGIGNIYTNPKLTNSEIGRFYLQSSSPCIDNGTPDTSGLNLPEYDILNNSRIENNRIDIGALEYHGNLSSLSEVQISNEIKIYPNPSNGLFNVEITNITNEKNIIEIFDSKGKMIYHDWTNSKYSQIDLSNYTTGMYYIRIKTSHLIKTKKIIIY